MNIHNSNIYLCCLLCFYVSSNFRFGIYFITCFWRQRGWLALFLFVYFLRLCVCVSLALSMCKNVRFSNGFSQAHKWTKLRNFQRTKEREKRKNERINIQHSIDIYKQRHRTQFKECEWNKLVVVFWLHFRCDVVM